VLGGISTDGQKPGQSTPQVQANAMDAVKDSPTAAIKEARLINLNFISHL
jgi:hypothetical protein